MRTSWKAPRRPLTESLNELLKNNWVRVNPFGYLSWFVGTKA